MTTGYRPELVQSAFLHFMGARLQPFWSKNQPRLRLIARHTLSTDLVALQFTPNAAFKQQGSWQGGQHVTLSILIDGIYHQRSYSLLGLPKRSAWHGASHKAVTSQTNSITIAIKPQGLVSHYLAKQAAIGTIVDTTLPSGSFTLPQEQPNQPLAPLLFIAGGSGITPMLGLIEQALAIGHAVTLLSYQRTSVLAHHWAHVRQQYPRFSYHLINTNDPTTYLAGTRHIEAAVMLALDLPLSTIKIFACGAPSLLAGLRRAADTITSQQTDGRLLRDHIVVEQFDNHPVTDEPQDHSGTEQTIYLRSRQRSFVSRSTLLSSATQAGIALPYGCRQGICHMCRCNKVSGVVKNTQTGQLSHDGFEPIQTCISVAMTDVVLDV